MREVLRKIIIIIISFIIIGGLLILNNLLWHNIESKDLQLVMRSVSALFIGLGIGKIAAAFWVS